MPGPPILNLFYAEPDPDRWAPLDRHPRRMIRRLVRGPARPGGHRRVFLNLRAGLDRLGAPYRVNDYPYLRKHPGELACVVGKPFLLDRFGPDNPMLFGAAIYSHPLDDPELLTRLPVRRVLAPGEWVRNMCEPIWGDAVKAWPVGIDADRWAPSSAADKDTDILIYDKVMWDRDVYEASLLRPIRAALEARGLSAREIRYGFYREEDFQAALARTRAMIFLCEHETQGIAYQQALSAGVPLLAWDRGGAWRDPSYYPDRVVFGPVTSVPYFDGRCGLRFAGAGDFTICFDRFWGGVQGRQYAPRDYILETLTLERCAQAYLDHAEAVS